MSELGELKRVEPRRIWKDEARDFTPWLRDHVEGLAKAVGRDIDLIENEVPVGEFSADLVGQEAGTKKPVVIENQLGRTDHDHLGKLLTYASGMDAGTLIWVATEFRGEHRQTLEWLNRISQEGISFLGVELQVFEIGDSRPAPHFAVVVGPAPIKPPPPAVGKRQQAYHEFFSALLDTLKKRLPGVTNASRVGYENWFSLSAGRSGTNFSFVFGQGQHFRVELYIDTGDADRNRRYFDELHRNRLAIEQKVGQAVSWEPLESARACRVSVYWPELVGVMDGTEALDKVRQWAIETFAKFREAARPYLRELRD